MKLARALVLVVVCASLATRVAVAAQHEPAGG